MIKQAEGARRFEEAESLAANLLELRREYDKQESARSLSQSSSVHANNPFLDESQMDFRNPKLNRASVDISNARNPFLADEEIKSPLSNKEDAGNPFLNDENERNPFLKEEDGENPFVPNANRPDDESEFESTSPAETNPLLQQICYVTKCLDEAVKLGKKDEAAIFNRNLAELQAMYDAQ